MERSLLSSLCAWCGLVNAGQQWRKERRAGPVRYTHGICPSCQTALLQFESLLPEGGAPAKESDPPPGGRARIGLGG